MVGIRKACPTTWWTLFVWWRLLKFAISTVNGRLEDVSTMPFDSSTCVSIYSPRFASMKRGSLAFVLTRMGFWVPGGNFTLLTYTTLRETVLFGVTTNFSPYKFCLGKLLGHRMIGTTSPFSSKTCYHWDEMWSAYLSIYIPPNISSAPSRFTTTNWERVICFDSLTVNVIMLTVSSQWFDAYAK